jgi:hypothetical protein
MNDDDRDFSAIDPANLLPFVCDLEPHNPEAAMLPKQFVGTDRALYGDGVYS